MGVQMSMKHFKDNFQIQKKQYVQTLFQNLFQLN